MLRRFLDRQAKLFQKGGKLEKFHALYEGPDTFLYTPGEVTKGASHVRDAIDLKRLMVTVVVALIPCVFMAMYNTGRQAHLAIQGGALPLDNWQTALMERLGLAFDPASLWANVAHGALYYLPVLLVTFLVGGNIEVVFAIVRRHEINEGFLVTGMLFPLILPPTIPLWQVAIGIAFGVVIGKEVFGGTGMNILNPALTARVFLFFAYPGQISGDKSGSPPRPRPTATAAPPCWDAPRSAASRPSSPRSPGCRPSSATSPARWAKPRRSPA
jgi:Na+-transporting NADH:ubiquinone oxidoreductase subunit B